MHIKQEKNTQNLGPWKEYYMPATIFKCAIRCKVIKEFIYLYDGANLWAVFNFKELVFALGKGWGP